MFVQLMHEMSGSHIAW